MKNNLKEKEQFMLAEILGRSIMKELLLFKTDIVQTHQSDWKLPTHWDVCLLSAGTLPMVTEIKVNYWRSNGEFEGRIKLNKFSNLMNLSRTEKGIQNGVEPYLLFIHRNESWLINLNNINRDFIDKNKNIKLVRRFESNTTVVDNGSSYHDYFDFPISEYGEKIPLQIDFKKHRQLALQIGKKYIDPSIEWSDEIHFWIDK